MFISKVEEFRRELYEAGKKDGLQEGTLNAQRGIAISLKKTGIEVSIISQSTGLSIEEIYKL